MFTLEEKIRCLTREVALRLAVYAKRIREKKIKPGVAEREINIMAEILDDYRAKLREQEGNVPDEPAD